MPKHVTRILFLIACGTISLNAAIASDILKIQTVQGETVQVYKSDLIAVYSGLPPYDLINLPYKNDDGTVTFENPKIRYEGDALGVFGDDNSAMHFCNLQSLGTFKSYALGNYDCFVQFDGAKLVLGCAQRVMRKITCKQ